MTTCTLKTYSLADLVSLFARLAKPVTDAIAAEFTPRPTAVPAYTPNPGRKVVGAIATEAAPLASTTSTTTAHVATAVEPSTAPHLAIAPIGTRPARKASRRDATGTHGVMDWKPDTQPGTGTLTIKAGRSTATYRVAETRTDWNGRAFHLTKLAGGTDRENEAYDVFVCTGPKDSHQCDCKGFAFGKGKPCKHVNAARVLVESNRL